MRNKNYTSFEEIELDLKLLSLERKIAIEELKGLKLKVQEDLSPLNWLQTGIKMAKKFGTLLLVKKLLK
ncbi:hypothetical protein I2486_09135 [Cellulophaga sp. E16_2]|uniref:Glutaminyl-tRNA synthetase n=1 Tax=Cellulophaga algicola (strain DSM 14237 / IC166 / ACAM 630) TaxID=688270 RepID=E6XDJ3_CELAD|nr:MULTISPECIES: hypothetical protein [Cellulophaga]ADV49125.1 glutaminyl-tRNA synthetase [Cellulophaga algicola DSM 14237]MBO0591572.1 hypothetical protein [Cellulophaga sp. E16_2]